MWADAACACPVRLWQIEPRAQPPTLWASLERNLQTAESLTLEAPAQQQLLQQVRSRGRRKGPCLKTRGWLGVFAPPL
jgi:hypothetical protein